MSLSDPDYNISAPIDILIGAELAMTLLTGESVIGDEEQLTATSKLGWLLSGRVSSKGSRRSIRNIIQSHHACLETQNIVEIFWKLESIPDVTSISKDENEGEIHFVETHGRDSTGIYVVQLPFRNDCQLGDSRSNTIKRLCSLERSLIPRPEVYDQYRSFIEEYLELGHMSLVPKEDIIKGRIHPVAINTDIAKMYRQIRISQEDSEFQRIVWRNDPHDKIKDYRLETVIYGTGCSPFLATRIIKQLVLNEQRGFELRKWTSNVPDVLSLLPNHLRSTNTNIGFEESKEFVNVLGLQWQPRIDGFTFKGIALPLNSMTKRGILSQAAKIFDPLDWISPFTTTIKLILQELWKTGLEWNDPIPEELRRRLTLINQNLPSLEHIQIPRCVVPADCASRGIFPSDLVEHPLWWNGPPWLIEPALEIKKFINSSKEEEKIKTYFGTIECEIPSIVMNCSSLTKLKCIIAWCLRFVNNIVKCVQSIEFSKEKHCLLRNKPIPNKSRIYNLCPFLNSRGIIRVGGRLKNVNIYGDRINQVLLPRSHHLTTLIVNNVHVHNLHSSTQAKLAAIRNIFWIPSGRNVVRKILRTCMKCARFRKKKKKEAPFQLMGNLPFARINRSRPFLVTGIDFAGLFLIKRNMGRTTSTMNAYVALFICFSTRAIHLELISSLTTDALISTIRRFIARRGKPATIHSDNATNFVEQQIYIIDSKTAKEAWTTLEQIFQPKSRARILQLKKQFVNIIKFIGDENIINYLSRLKTCSDHLREAECKVKDEDMAFSMLAGLPDLYDGIIMNSGNMTDDEFTSSKVKQVLLTEHERRTTRKEDSSKEVLQNGHNAANCRGMKQTTIGNRENQHYQRKVNRSDNFLAALNLTSDEDSWLLDSGATSFFYMLTGSNYRSWKFKMKMLLIERGFWECVINEKTIDADENQRKYEKTKKQGKALATIALSISTEQQIYIIDSKTSKEAWTTLEQIFQPKSRARILQLKKQFVNIIKFIGDENMINYLSRLKTCSDHLREAECEVKDEDMAFSMLAGLPDLYDGIIMNSGSMTDDEFTSSKVKQVLLTEHERRTTRKEDSSKEVCYRNLLLVSKIEENGNRVTFRNMVARIFHPENRIISEATNVNGLYIVEESQKLIERKHVRFDESKIGLEWTNIVEETEPENYNHVCLEPETNYDTDLENEIPSNLDSVGVEDALPQPSISKNIVRIPCGRKGKPGVELNLLDVTEPQNFEEAVRSPEAVYSRKTIYDELRVLQEQGTWELSTLPPVKKPISSRWVYKVKPNESGNVERFKACLVAREQQIYIIDSKTAKEAWTTLEQIFQPKSRARILQLKKQFVNIIKFIGDENIKNYLSRLNTCSDHLREAECEVKDEDMAFSMLAGLPDLYDGIIMNSGSMTDDEFTSSKVKQVLLTEHERRTTRKEDSSKEVLQNDHNAANCRGMKQTTIGNRENQHYQRKVNRSDNFLAALNLTSDEDSWLLDTGATSFFYMKRSTLMRIRENMRRQKKQGKALATIALSISTEQQTYIIDSKTAKEAWTTLEQIFQPKLRARILQLKKQFVNIIKFIGDENMINYLPRLKTCSDHLREAECEVKDEDMAFSMLAGLPDLYDGIIMNSGSMTDDEFTSSKVKQVLLTEHERRTTRKEDSSKEIGHNAANCRGMKQTTIGNRENQHYQRKVNRSDNFLAALNLTSDEDSWLLDSGAANHACRNKDWCVDLQGMSSYPIMTAGGTTEAKGYGRIFLQTNLLLVSKIEENGNRVTFRNMVARIFHPENRIISEATNVNGLYIVEESQKLIERKHVRFDESKIGLEWTNIVEETEPENYNHVCLEPETNYDTDLENEIPSNLDSVGVEDALPQPSISKNIVRIPCGRKGKPGVELNLLDVTEPQNFEEAVRSPEAVYSRKTMDDELRVLQEQGTWELSTLPPVKKPISSRWVYKVKPNESGNVERFKACLVAREQQIYIIDSKTAKEAWTTLEQIFQPKLRARILQLKKQFVNIIKFIGDENIINYLSRLKTCSDHLREAECEVKDEDMAFSMLAGLPDLYDGIIMNSGNMTDDEFTSSKIGHNAANCRGMKQTTIGNRENQHYQRKVNRSDNFLAALNLTSDEDSWLLDSGATNHDLLLVFKIEENGNRVTFRNMVARISNQENKIIAEATNVNGLYIVEESQKVIERKHVRFDESKIGLEWTNIVEETEPENYNHVCLEPETNYDTDLENEIPSNLDSVGVEDALPQPSISKNIVRIPCGRKGKQRVELNLLDVTEPQNFEEAIRSPEAVYWRKAMDDELRMLQEQGTWELSTLPPVKKPISSRWVYKVKPNESGNVERFKACLVARALQWGNDERSVDTGTAWRRCMKITDQWERPTSISGKLGDVHTKNKDTVALRKFREQIKVELGAKDGEIEDFLLVYMMDEMDLRYDRLGLAQMLN
ncbi:hypothetical protein LAZ67_3002613 [Cordylochernes scorpioides]|uniref:Integrase catalytic domain-containing protein n=1 Tax=Cordylochernes scorpioides TaxID=51811 RepID=A0ABY6K8R7_9ARAC|nr:hypothetical protein LAZ67_3002613 [Cordylochernes scorpioides]